MPQIKFKPKKETVYVSILIVHVPSAASLIDMLRYERCVPRSEDESRKIWALIGTDTCGNSDDPMNHIIELVRFASSDCLASPRWKSFNCTVLVERSTDAPSFTKEQLLGLLTLKQSGAI